MRKTWRSLGPCRARAAVGAGRAWSSSKNGIELGESKTCDTAGDRIGAQVVAGETLETVARHSAAISVCMASSAMRPCVTITANKAIEAIRMHSML